MFGYEQIPWFVLWQEFVIAPSHPTNAIRRDANLNVLNLMNRKTLNQL